MDRKCVRPFWNRIATPRISTPFPLSHNVGEGAGGEGHYVTSQEPIRGTVTVKIITKGIPMTPNPSLTKLITFVLLFVMTAGSLVHLPLALAHDAERPATVDLAQEGGVAAVSVGWLHTCVLLRDGAVRCWGASGEGRTAVPADLGPVKAVSAGYDHSCVLTQDDRVRCWGGNSFGQSAVPADLGAVKQLSARINVTCVLTQDDRVRCWGIPVTNQIMVPPDLGPVSAMDASLSLPPGNGVTCAITGGGGVRCWGNIPELDGMPPPADLGPANQISAGGSHACVIRDDGSLRCWGSNGQGQTAVPGGLGTVRQVSAGFFHTCAVTSANALRCWGFNANGQINVPASLGPVVQVSAGYQHTCAVTTSGGLSCWGSDEQGQLGEAQGIPWGNVGPGEPAVTQVPAAPATLVPAPRMPTSGEIAFVHGGLIYLLDLATGQRSLLFDDGSVGTLDTDGHLSWSPDGQQLAFTSRRAGSSASQDIYLFDMRSRSVERVSNDPRDAYAPSFGPDGSLYFVQIIEPHERNRVDGSWALMRRSPDGTITTVSSDRFYATHLHATAGGRVLTMTDSNMQLGYLETGHPTITWDNNSFNCQWPGGRYSAFSGAWSNNGNRVAVISADCPSGDSSGNQRTSIFLLDAANSGANARRLFSSERGMYQVDWSPDDNWLVYSHSNPEGNSQLWLISSRGGTPQLISGLGLYPAWRPVGGGSGSVQLPGVTATATATSAPTATPVVASSDTATSYLISGQVRDDEGNPVANIVISSDNCGSTRTDANGTYVLSWYAVEATTCTIRPYEANVAADAWGGVFDPPVATLTVYGAEEQDFVISSRRRPLILIHGVMGSRLSYSNASGRTGDLECWTGRWFVDMECSAQFDDHVISSEIIKRYANIDFYETLIETLTNSSVNYINADVSIQSPATALEYCQNSPNTRSFFIFNYDWRKSNIENANELHKFIQCIQEKTEHRYVDVVAHSMGGILTRRYVLDRANAGEEHYIDRFISIGTPWLGAPELIYVLETGAKFPITPFILTAESLKTLAEHFTGVHELLPGSTYFKKAGVVFREKGWDYNQRNGDQETYSHEDLVYVLNSRFSNDPGTASKDFHTEEQNNLSEWYGVEHFNFYGRIDKDKTVQTVTSQIRKICITIKCWEWEVLVPTFHQGDASVPLVSAVPPPLREPEHCGFSGGRVTRFCGSQKQAGHTEMTQSAEVIEALISILARRSPAAPQVAYDGPSDGISAQQVSFGARSATADYVAEPAHYLMLINSVGATLSDALGNSTDVISGTFSDFVPEVSYHVIGDQSYMFVIPTDEPYTLTMPVNLEPMYLELRTGTGDTTSQIVRYQDLAFPLTTTAQLSINPQGGAELRYDSNGDGLFDTLVPPTAQASGAAAQDDEPPEVTITVQRQGAGWRASIVANDSGSGVQQILYSTDDQHYERYSGPFAVSSGSAEAIYAFADDSLANRSPVARYDLPQDNVGAMADTFLIAMSVFAFIFTVGMGGGLGLFLWLQHPAQRPRPRQQRGPKPGPPPPPPPLPRQGPQRGR
ncbi:MAG: alpha/beta hydrolase [Candidatus Viridilinea halotolerans]|uniref:Alpha/beta hydrolase n=1 Tax=Candidatus Viridilinea halotolerans TaxID=2491704 RepID=A0A426TY12_9CHLR|nr:MAG: alpha/beta hydrolase [Candidatus Viridilinea halotolerans]